MIAKQLNTTRLLESRLRPLREDSESSLVEVNRPRKRVKFSTDQPKIHPFDEQTLGDEQSSRQQTNYGETANTFLRAEQYLPNYEHQQQQRQYPLPRSWITPREMFHFRSDAMKTSKSVNVDHVLQAVFDESSSEDESVVRTNKLLQSDDFLVQRGLEQWSSNPHAFQRKVRALEVKVAVFLEQGTQVLSGRSDPEMISKVSVEASRASQRFAQFLATIDAEVAMEVHASDMD